MKCDYCKKKAIVNVQKVWVAWTINNDKYSSSEILDVEEPAGDENLHLCEKHYQKFLEGEI